MLFLCAAGRQDVEKFLSGRKIRLSKDRINCGGGNYGELEVLDNIVRFSSENRWGGCSYAAMIVGTFIYICIQQY